MAPSLRSRKTPDPSKKTTSKQTASKKTTSKKTAGRVPAPKDSRICPPANEQTVARAERARRRAETVEAQLKEQDAGEGPAMGRKRSRGVTKKMKVEMMEEKEEITEEERKEEEKRKNKRKKKGEKIDEEQRKEDNIAEENLDAPAVEDTPDIEEKLMAEIPAKASKVTQILEADDAAAEEIAGAEEAPAVEENRTFEIPAETSHMVEAAVVAAPKKVPVRQEIRTITVILQKKWTAVEYDSDDEGNEEEDEIQQSLEAQLNGEALVSKTHAMIEEPVKPTPPMEASSKPSTKVPSKLTTNRHLSLKAGSTTDPSSSATTSGSSNPISAPSTAPSTAPTEPSELFPLPKISFKPRTKLSSKHTTKLSSKSTTDPSSAATARGSSESTKGPSIAPINTSQFSSLPNASLAASLAKRQLYPTANPPSYSTTDPYPYSTAVPSSGPAKPTKPEPKERKERTSNPPESTVDPSRIVTTESAPTPTTILSSNLTRKRKSAPLTLKPKDRWSSNPFKARKPYRPYKSNERRLARRRYLHTATGSQANALSRLFTHPDREIKVPPPVTAKTFPAPPQVVARVLKTSAGAPSGDVYAYAARRRKECERLRMMTAKNWTEHLQRQFDEMKERWRRIDEERTERRRRKRAKRRERRGMERGDSKWEEMDSEDEDVWEIKPIRRVELMRRREDSDEGEEETQGGVERNLVIIDDDF